MEIFCMWKICEICENVVQNFISKIWGYEREKKLKVLI